MWSLIPWRRLIVLATPFIKEVFIGRFNLLGYFLKNKAIAVLFLTLICNYLAFQYVSLGYDALSIKNQTLDKQNKQFLVKIGELQSQLTTLSEVASDTPRSSVVSVEEASSRTSDNGVSNSEDDLYKQALYEIMRLKQEERHRKASTHDDEKVKGEVHNENQQTK